MAEKKIIEGKTRNAKLSNIGLSPNKKFAPSFEKLISLVIALSKSQKKVYRWVFLVLKMQR